MASSKVNEALVVLLIIALLYWIWYAKKHEPPKAQEAVVSEPYPETENPVMYGVTVEHWKDGHKAVVVNADRFEVK